MAGAHLPVLALRRHGRRAQDLHGYVRADTEGHGGAQGPDGHIRGHAPRHHQRHGEKEDDGAPLRAWRPAAFATASRLGAPQCRTRDPHAARGAQVRTCLDAIPGSDIFVGFFGQRYGSSNLQDGGTGPRSPPATFAPARAALHLPSLPRACQGANRLSVQHGACSAGPLRSAHGFLTARKASCFVSSQHTQRRMRLNVFPRAPLQDYG